MSVRSNVRLAAANSYPILSQKLNSRHKKGLRFHVTLVLYGAGTRSRTRDLLITSQLLYQLSYTGI